jgi:signal transduction histidine kinase
MHLRPGDRDRDAVTQILRDHHLAGRLNSAEFEQRLERCLAARTCGELDAITADLPDRDPDRWPIEPSYGRARGTMRGMRVRRVLRGLAGLVAILLLAIWILSSAELPFWPAWPWLGLGIPFALDAAIRWAWHRPAGPKRQAVIVWSVAGVIEGTLVLVWALESLNGGGPAYFWPAWSLLGLVTLASIYYIVAVHPRLDPDSGRAVLAARVESLSRSRRETVDAQAAELGRIERDIHDGAQARLVALSIQLGRAELALEDQPGARRLVEDARQEASRAIADLRDLSRGIAPPLLSDRGLVAAVRGLAARYDADVEVAPGLESKRLAPALERGAYFVVAEALTNAAKHSGAQRVSVKLGSEAAVLTVTVADEGRGGADPTGSGLSGLRGRVEALGGTLRLASSDAGTRLEARFPAAS